MLALAKGGMDGTTSAHAENTTPPRGSCENPRNYLRARGEYQGGDLYLHIESGTTSAHAENTARITSLRGIRRNYLRARGEYRPQR